MIIFFLLPVLSVIFIRATGLVDTVGGESALISRDLFFGIVWLSIASTAVFGASLGLWMSFFVRNTQRSEIFNAKNSENFFIVFMIFSTILGVLTLSIFLGGLINGSLFPSFSVDSYYFGGDFLPSDFGKLIFWSVASGFSERLIPDFMDRMVIHFSPQTIEDEEKRN